LTPDGQRPGRQLARREVALYRNLCDERGQVRRHLNVYVNADNVRDLEAAASAIRSSG